ncbi:putative membrane protein [Helicobacter pylori CPY6261]|nr:putative membrane protein [Helicobacter pylori CPY6261]
MFSVWFKCCWFVLGVYGLFFYSFILLYSAGVAFYFFCV